MITLKKYGIVDKQLIIIHRRLEYKNNSFYIASLSKGYPRFQISTKDVYVPEDQTTIKLLFEKKITKAS